MGVQQSDRLVAIVEDKCELFHDGHMGFADVDAAGHRETWPVRPHGFRLWLRHRYYEAHGGAPNSGTLQSALDTIEARAQVEGEHRQVFRRVAVLDTRFYLDLGNREWQAVEIDVEGWRVLDCPPVRFTRSQTTRALPRPVRGGCVGDLRPFLNIGSDDEFALIQGWMVAALREAGPYPVLVLQGEHGSAKSWTVRIVRALIDPNEAPLRSSPRNERDLFVSARNSHVVALDNLSTIPSWLSDALCRLSTSGGFATRRLYTDSEEVVISVARPVVLNSIDTIVTRGDLTDRAIFLDLPRIATTRRRTERTLWSQFEHERPRILGALLDAVTTGINSLPDVRLDQAPRMADVATWVTACEPPERRGAFLAAYERNRAEAVWSVLETNPVASVILTLMAGKPSWAGEPTELYVKLSEIAARTGMRARGWPANPQALSRQLNALRSALRPVGIVLTRERSARRRIRITRSGGECREIASNASTSHDAIDAIDAIRQPDSGLNRSEISGDSNV